MFVSTRMVALVGFSLALGVAQAADYESAAESAKAEFTPVGEAEIAAARSRLAERVIAAERMLGPTTSQGAAWLDYLEWDGLQKQLGPDSEIDLPAATETLRLLGSGAEGLEKRELQAVGEAIEDYVGVAQFARAPEDRQQLAFDQAIDGLATQLAKHEWLNSALESFRAEQALGRIAGLESTGRGREFVQRVRSDYGRTNLYIEVDGPMLNRLVARPVNECSPLEDCILGTRIRGTGATRGSLRVTTLPSYDRARLLFELSGTTRSNTTGVNGPVSIRSVGDTSFRATKIVELSNESFRVLPASVDATTRSRTQSVDKIGGGLGSRIVENIAKRRIAEKRGQADRIASSRAEGRVATRLNQQLESQIVDARRRYDEGLTRPLRRRRATPRRLTQQTTSNSLLVEAVFADDDQLAANASPPGGIAAPLSARVHKTAIDNLLGDTLGGATFRQATTDGPVTADIVVPDWLELDAPDAPPEEFKPWRLTLRQPRPVSVELADGAATVTVHAAEFESGDKTFKDWDILVTYRPQLIDGRWRLVRQGDVQVLLTGEDPEKPGRLRGRETYVAERSVLAERLNQVTGGLPQVIDIDPIDLTDRRGPVRWLSMAGIQMEDGWLASGWRAL